MMDTDRAAPPGTGLPALPAPEDQGDDDPCDPPGGRVTKSYSPAARLALMLRALQDGVSDTSRRTGVPRSTVIGWFKEFGGLEAVRERLTAEAFGDFLAAERSIYDAVVRRADELPADELMVTFRRLVEARLIPPLVGSDTEGNGQAVAAAQAMVKLEITEKDGKVSVIDLGVPPEDTE